MVPLGKNYFLKIKKNWGFVQFAVPWVEIMIHPKRALSLSPLNW